MLGLDLLDRFLLLGFDERNLYHMVKDGWCWALVVLPEEACGVFEATWDNVEAIVGEMFEEVHEAVCRHLPEIRRTPFNELEKDVVERRGASMVGGRWKGLDSKGYMDSKGLLDLGADATASDVRAFLYQHFGLHAWFSGNGRTPLSSGEEGFREYFGPNRDRTELEKPGAVYIPLGKPSLEACLQRLCERHNQLKLQLSGA